MKIILTVLISVLCLYGYSKEDYSAFNTPLPKKEQPKKEECLKICKKQLERAEAIDVAIRYYKQTQYHSFSSSKKRSR